MSIWDRYTNRVTANSSNRDAIVDRSQKFISKRIKDSASYFNVTIDNVQQNVAIINTDNLNEKFIYSLPNEDIVHGGLVCWMDNRWLVTEKDAATEMYTRAKMIQCNYLLRWVDSENTIHEQWCVIEDGTKYLTGELSDRDFITTRGDSRLVMTIAKNQYTSKFNRTCRFLIDDEDSDEMLAYELTKPYKLGGTYNGKGVFKFVLQEVNTTDFDNKELRIADYYKHFPKEGNAEVEDTSVINPNDNIDELGRGVWI